MRNILVLARREVASYFVSSVAYVAMALFLVLSGAFFLLRFRPGEPADLRTLFNTMTFILMFVVPIITMRSLAEEHRSGTLESLVTAPVTDTQVVLGKFLGCYLFYLAMLAPTLVYAIVLAAFGDPDPGPIASGYLGLLAAGALFVGVGVLASSMTRSQVIAAVTAVVILLVLVVLETVSALVPSPWRTILRQASPTAHTADFAQGIVDLVHVVYFAALTGYALFLTVKVLESRRWR